MPARMARVMRSPKLAAMGVATLSGLIPVFLEPTITPTIMIPKHKQKMAEYFSCGHYSQLLQKLYKIWDAEILIKT